MGSKGECRGHAADGRRRDGFSHRHARKSSEKDHGLWDAVGKAAGENDRPSTAPVEQALIQRPPLDEALRETPRGSEHHQAVIEKAAGDQALTAKQSAKQRRAGEDDVNVRSESRGGGLLQRTTLVTRSGRMRRLM